MPEYPPPAVQHICNASSFFCRFIDEGMPRDEAHIWSRRIEAILHPHLYPQRESGCQPPVTETGK
jgi:hypothetical protein